MNVISQVTMIKTQEANVVNTAYGGGRSCEKVPLDYERRQAYLHGRNSGENDIDETKAYLPPL